MKKPNKNLTFAERAKKIISKYKRADFDKIEKDQLELELKALSEEQEQYKREHNLGEYSGEQAINMQHDGYNPGSSSYLYDKTDPEIGLESWMTDFSLPNSSNNTSSIDLTSTSKGMLPTSSLSPYSTSIIPSAISGLVTTGANLYLANRAGKNIPEIKLPRISAQNISLNRARNDVRRDSQNTSRVLRSNLGKSSRTRGEYLSNVISGSSAINKSTANALSDLYSKEAALNASERARVSNINANLATTESTTNLQSRMKANADKQAYLSAALQAIPQTVSNIAGIKQQDSLINSLGQDYSIGQYNDPSLNWLQKIIKPKQIVRMYNK